MVGKTSGNGALSGSNTTENTDNESFVSRGHAGEQLRRKAGNQQSVAMRKRPTTESNPYGDESEMARLECAIIVPERSATVNQSPGHPIQSQTRKFCESRYGITRNTRYVERSNDVPSPDVDGSTRSRFVCRCPVMAVKFEHDTGRPAETCRKTDFESSCSYV